MAARKVDHPEYGYWAVHELGASVKIKTSMSVDDQGLREINVVTWVIKSKSAKKIELEGFSETPVGGEVLRFLERSMIAKRVSAHSVQAFDDIGEQSVTLEMGTFTAHLTRRLKTVGEETATILSWWTPDVPGGLLKTVIEDEEGKALKVREVIAFRPEGDPAALEVIEALKLKSEQSREDEDQGEDEEPDPELDAAWTAREIKRAEREIEDLKAEGKSLRAIYRTGDLHRLKGAWSEALDSYLDYFEKTRGIEGHEGVRVSFLLRRIAGLGEKHPAALDRLQELRSCREQRILAFEASWMDLIEWGAITGELVEGDEPLLEVYRALNATPAHTEAEKDALFQLQYFLRRELFEQGLYGELEGVIYSIYLDLKEAEELSQTLVDEGLMGFETQLRLGNRQAYEAIGEQLLAKSQLGDLVDMYGELLEITGKTGHEDYAQSLRQRAESELSAEDVAEVFD